MSIIDIPAHDLRGEIPTALSMDNNTLRLDEVIISPLKVKTKSRPNVNFMETEMDLNIT